MDEIDYLLQQKGTLFLLKILEILLSPNRLLIAYDWSFKLTNPTHMLHFKLLEIWFLVCVEEAVQCMLS